MKYIILACLWISYVFISFSLFPKYNVNMAIPSIALYALSAWLLDSSKALIIFMLTMPYHMFLMDFYGDILTTYQAKAFGTCTPVIVVFLVGSLKQQRDQLKHLSVILDKKVAERTQELNQLIEQLISDDELLRRSLGQDIHDGLGQNLTGLLLYSSSVKNDLESSHSKYVPQVEDIIHDAGKSLNMARKVSRTLFPFKMMETGLESALDELTSYFGESGTLNFKIDLDGSEESFQEDTIIHFYRIIYESILNTVHNDNPSLIHISLRTKDGSHCLSMVIDGCDDPSSICNNMFIELMRYRAKLIHGNLTTHISAENIIKIKCLVPVDGSVNIQRANLDAE